MTSTDHPTPGASIDAAPSEKRPRPSLRRVGALAGLGALGLVSLYVGVMAILWGLHITALRADVADLRAELADAKAQVSDGADALSEQHGTLDETLDSVSSLVNDKAQAEDYKEVYDEFGDAFVSCADAQADVISYVRNHSIWVPGPLHAYDNDVRAYCNDLITYYDENTAAEAEGEES